MTTGQERLQAATAAFNLAQKRVTDYIGRASVPGSSPPASPGAPLDEEWGAKLDSLEEELKRAIAELMLAAREVMGEQASGS